MVRRLRKNKRCQPECERSDKAPFPIAAGIASHTVECACGEEMADEEADVQPRK